MLRLLRIECAHPIYLRRGRGIADARLSVRGCERAKSHPIWGIGSVLICKQQLSSMDLTVCFLRSISVGLKRPRAQILIFAATKINTLRPKPWIFDPAAPLQFHTHFFQMCDCTVNHETPEVDGSIPHQVDVGKFYNTTTRTRRAYSTLKINNK